jgi:hypothetical protein
MVSWIVYTIVEGIRRWHLQRTLGQFQVKLLDKIGSVSELGAFLNTEAGARFLKGLTSEAAGPHVRILSAVQSGLVLAALGLGLCLYGWFGRPPGAPGAISDDSANVLNAVATILFSLGVGFLASAYVSYRMSKRMGLLAEGNRHEPGVLPTA